MDKALFLLGRLVFGGYFIYNGVNHFQNHEMISGYAGSKGVPQPRVAVAATGAMLLAGGASIVLGLKPKIGTGLIATFLLSVSPQIHNYWGIEDAGEQMNQRVNFLKNMGLLGATMSLAGVPEPWPLSLSQVQPESERVISRGRNAA